MITDANSSLYDLMRRGEFPKPLQLGPGTVGWYEHEIDAWLESRPRGGLPARCKSRRPKLVISA